MPQLGQAQTGLLKSTAKVCKVMADDGDKLVYKFVGNGHAYPFIWAETVTHSGTETTIVASGTKWHGFAVTDMNVTVTPIEDPGAVRIWIEKDATAETVVIKSSASVSNVDFDVKIMMGNDPSVSSVDCRGNRGAAPALP